MAARRIDIGQIVVVHNATRPSSAPDERAVTAVEGPFVFIGARKFRASTGREIGNGNRDWFITLEERAEAEAVSGLWGDLRRHGVDRTIGGPAVLTSDQLRRILAIVQE